MLSWHARGAGMAWCACDRLAGVALPTGARLARRACDRLALRAGVLPALAGVLPALADGLQPGRGRVVQARHHRLAARTWPVRARLRPGWPAVDVAALLRLAGSARRIGALAGPARLAVLLRRPRRSTGTPKAGVSVCRGHGPWRHRRLAGLALRRRAAVLAGRARAVRAGLLRRIRRAALLTGLAGLTRMLLRPAARWHRRTAALLRRARPERLALRLPLRRRRRTGPHRAGRLLIALARHGGAWCGRSFRPRRCAPMTLLGTLVRHWCLTAV